MDRKAFYDRIQAPGELDYELYIGSEKLLSCQKPYETLINRDELQFQIVHQVEELWMKLIAYTLLDVDEFMKAGETHRVVTLMGRCHRLVRLMIEQLDLLETMSPKEYQQIRLQLGNGSGQESPGFRTLLKMPQHLWDSYVATYLTPHGRTVRSVYDHDYAHDAAYVVAEALIEFDELFGKFRANHMFLIQRSIGMGSSSLKGRPVEILQSGIRQRFFPELWDVRVAMTDDWGGEYGRVRDSLSVAGQPA